MQRAPLNEWTGTSPHPPWALRNFWVLCVGPSTGSGGLLSKGEGQVRQRGSRDKAAADMVGALLRVGLWGHWPASPALHKLPGARRALGDPTRCPPSPGGSRPGWELHPELPGMGDGRVGLLHIVYFFAQSSQIHNLLQSPQEQHDVTVLRLHFTGHSAEAQSGGGCPGSPGTSVARLLFSSP